MGKYKYGNRKSMVDEVIKDITEIPKVPHSNKTYGKVPRNKFKNKLKGGEK